MRILVADDERDMNMLICAVMTSAGHTPVPAFDGASTMMIATRSPQPDLIILDVRMPAGEGQTTLVKLKQLSKTAMIPVVIFTALHDEELKAKLLGGGAAAFLQKPIDPQTLIQTVNALLMIPRPES